MGAATDWNPLEFRKYSDPRLNAWTLSQAPGSLLDVRAQRLKTIRATWVPVLVMVVIFVVLAGNSELRAFWSVERGWASILQAGAIAAAVAALVQVIRLARRRYASTVTEDGLPPPPVWFRFCLAALELGQFASLLGFLVWLMVDRYADWLIVPSICLIAGMACAMVGSVLRWHASTFGWTTGRLFWGNFD